jgi:galactonate dehydratase
MKITDCKTYVYSTPWRNLTYLVLETDTNLRGVGEARVIAKTHTVCEYLKDIRRHIVDHSVYDIEDLYRRITIEDFGRAGEVEMSALALVEMACWDLIGKQAKLPVYQLIGGKVHDRIPAYANGWYTVEREPEAFAQASKKVTDAGYLGLKFDPFGAGDLELTRAEFNKSVALIEAVRDAVGDDIEIYCEMHGRFAPHQAVAIAKAIEPLHPAWIEEPCRADDIGALEYVRDHTCIPIATGERLYKMSDYRELFERRAAHIIQPDLNQCGGLLEVKKIAAAAEMFSIMVAPHNVGGIITTAATMHLLVTLRNAKVLEHFNDFVDADVQSLGAPYPAVVDGHFQVPNGPGWGVEIDFDALEKHEPNRVNGIIADPGLNMFKDAEWNARRQKR